MLNKGSIQGSGLGTLQRFLMGSRRVLSGPHKGRFAVQGFWS